MFDNHQLIYKLIIRIKNVYTGIDINFSSGR